MRNKIIYITTLLPYPLDMGGKIKTFSTLKQLAKKDDVYFFSFVDKRKDIIYEKELKDIGVKQCVTVVSPVIAQKHRLIQLMILLMSVFSSKPYSVYKYFNKKMSDEIDKFLKKNKTDIIWVDHTIQTQYWPKNFKGLKILETHNYKTDFFKNMFLTESNLFYKIFSFYEWLKFKFYEPVELRKASLVFAISKDEKKKIERFNKNVKVLFPNIKITDNIGKFGTKKLFFVGLLTWYPNKQGVSWFVEEVFPDLKKEIPEITLDVVGDYYYKWRIPKYNGVKLHGYIKDIKNFWKDASIFIVPLWYGSGIRIKILEALANGIPVVSTSAGAEGLPAVIKEKIFIKDSKEEIINVVKKLCKNKNLYLNYAREGKKILNSLENLKLNDILKN
ncbi:MAG: glycosyltransferase [bacterium]|nr:glycosyltransferase [bacterium]